MKHLLYLILLLVTACPNKQSIQPQPQQESKIFDGSGSSSKNDQTDLFLITPEDSLNTNLKIQDFAVINAPDAALRINANYQRNERNFDTIFINNLTIKDYRSFGLRLQTSNTHIILKNFALAQNDSVTTVSGSKGLGIAAPPSKLQAGNTLDMDFDYQVTYPKASVLFGQNLKDFFIKSIVIDSAFSSL